VDAAKAKKLKDIKYTIAPCCGTCRWYGTGVDARWGDCTRHEYVHEKHTGPARPLSVTAYGSCADHVAGEDQWLHGFRAYIKTPR
jgi:hypothetical protein